MGMFSWYRADNTTKRTNLVEGDTFKVLIPKEFGGGFIKGKYSGYGDCIVSESEQYDVYELLAFWNEAAITQAAIEHCLAPSDGDYTLHFDGEKPLVPKQTVHTDHNRSLGIDIGCYDRQIKALKYPLKLVSASYKGTYEDCEGISLSDPDQGFWRKYRR